MSYRQTGNIYSTQGTGYDNQTSVPSRSPQAVQVGVVPRNSRSVSSTRTTTSAHTQPSNSYGVGQQSWGADPRYVSSTPTQPYIGSQDQFHTPSIQDSAYHTSVEQRSQAPDSLPPQPITILQPNPPHSPISPQSSAQYSVSYLGQAQPQFEAGHISRGQQPQQSPTYYQQPQNEVPGFQRSPATRYFESQIPPPSSGYRRNPEPSPSGYPRNPELSPPGYPRKPEHSPSGYPRNPSPLPSGYSRNPEPSLSGYAVINSVPSPQNTTTSDGRHNRRGSSTSCDQRPTGLACRLPDLGLSEGYPPSMKESLHATTPSDMDSILYAMRLQRAFDDEDHALSTQRTELVNVAQCLFECGICMDDVPMDSIALIDNCGHSFCRECLRGHISTCLREHRFPVRCPTCTANKGKGKGKEQTGEVSQSLALDLGLTDEQLNIWTEMEMVEFSILLRCRKCQRSMFVARDEHDSVSVIACPLPDCDHIWCRQCQQSIDLNGPRHSCDGTTELDHLVKEQGWKYCPTCKTPIQKTSGCNHMTCITPACNTHFCYLCGNLIVKSTLSQEIEDARSSHYRRGCRPFEVPE